MNATSASASGHPALLGQAQHGRPHRRAAVHGGARRVVGVVEVEHVRQVPVGQRRSQQTRAPAAAEHRCLVSRSDLVRRPRGTPRRRVRRNPRGSRRASPSGSAFPDEAPRRGRSPSRAPLRTRRSPRSRPSRSVLDQQADLVQLLPDELLLLRQELAPLISHSQLGHDAVLLRERLPRLGLDELRKASW